MRREPQKCYWIATLLAIFWAGDTVADEADELAKKLANPVASLISVPFQLNFDYGGGARDDGRKQLLNIQPVIPISISEDWNLISRTILPIAHQSDITGNGRSESGVGDIVQSVFFSPKAPTESGLIWGVGPVALLPTATDTALGTEKWAIGPTGVVLKQQGKWTLGALANHLVSVAGDDSRSDINATFLQPFVTYGPGDGWSFTANMEATVDWENDVSIVPVNLIATKVVSVGSQLLSVGGGVRAYVDKPAGGPDWGLRLAVVLLFPK